MASQHLPPLSCREGLYDFYSGRSLRRVSLDFPQSSNAFAPTSNIITMSRNMSLSCLASLLRITCRTTATIIEE